LERRTIAFANLKLKESGRSKFDTTKNEPGDFGEVRMQPVPLERKKPSYFYR